MISEYFNHNNKKYFKRFDIKRLYKLLCKIFIKNKILIHNKYDLNTARKERNLL